MLERYVQASLTGVCTNYHQEIITKGADDMAADDGSIARSMNPYFSSPKVRDMSRAAYIALLNYTRGKKPGVAELNTLASVLKLFQCSLSIDELVSALALDATSPPHKTRPERSLKSLSAFRAFLSESYQKKQSLISEDGKQSIASKAMQIESNPEPPVNHRIPISDKPQSPAIHQEKGNKSRMKVVSLINYKGGVGKTTLSVNLVAGIARKKRVLAIDLDPQSNLTFSFMTAEEWKSRYKDKKTIKKLFDAAIDQDSPSPALKDLIVTAKGIDLICSDLGLIDIDSELVAAGSGGATDRQLKSNFVRAHSHLRRALKTIEDDYDLVIIDCPPNFNMATRNAIVASDYYLVPAKMDYLSTMGINQLVGKVNGVKNPDGTVKIPGLVDKYNDNVEDQNEHISPEFLGVVATMVQMRNGGLLAVQQRYVNELTYSNIGMFKSMIRENKTLFSANPEEDAPVILQRLAGDTYKAVVDELQALQREFEEKVGLL